MKPKDSPSGEKQPQLMSIPLNIALTIAPIKTRFNIISNKPVSLIKTPNKNKTPRITSAEERKHANGRERFCGIR